MTLKRRVLLSVAYVLSGTLGLLLVFVQAARLPILVLLLVWFAADIPIALRGARRKR
jgi:hypothetical protein